MLDDRHRRAHKLRNARQSLLLVGGLTIVTAFSAYLLWSWPGVFVTLAWIFGLYMFAPRIPPEAVMAMYRASKLDPRRGTPSPRSLRRSAGAPSWPRCPTSTSSRA